MTFLLQGVGVSRGIAIGPAHILERDQLDIHEYSIDDNAINEEVRRFQNALTQARQQLRAVREHIPITTAGDITAFIDTHLLMLQDEALTAEPIRLIRELKRNAEWALKLQRDALVTVFEEMDDAYLRTRKDDVDHVVNRLQRILLNHMPLKHESAETHLRDYIVIADDLSPADTVMMGHHGIAALVTESGGPTSHTAILARSLAIPSVVGVHTLQRYIHEDDQLIVDGRSGAVLVDPDEAMLAYYRKRIRDDRRYYAELGKLKEAPAITLDGVEIELHANIELPKDYEAVRKVGARGVGLYRTEFLYMNRRDAPDEDEQYRIYTRMLRALKDVPVTIRTLDLGADKSVDGAYGDGGPANPALGLRAIRLCLKEPELFLPQLRALIRASAKGDLRIMIPMLSNLQEVQQVLEMVHGIQDEFRGKKIKFNPDMPIGGMIEVPAAAICAEAFASRLDFLSIGTNDLIQYTMAIDRVNDEVNYLYDPLHPAVLRLIQNTIEAGQRLNKPVAVCGEMAGDVDYARLLLGLGLTRFSVHPASLLEIKRIICESDTGKLKKKVKRYLKDACSSQSHQGLEDINDTPA